MMENLKIQLAVVYTAAIMFAIGMFVLGFLINNLLIDPAFAGGLLSAVSFIFFVFLLIKMAVNTDPQNAKENTPAIVSKE